MRSLEERIAEIDRRSKQIIHMRKQRRKHMLMACIPLVLCMTAASAFFLPEVDPGHKNGAPAGATEAQPGELTQDRQESASCHAAQIDISGQDISLSYTDEAKVELFCDWLNACTVKYSENNSMSDAVARGEEFDETQATHDDTDTVAEGSADMEFTITVTQNGGKTEHYLAENTLTNLTTNQTYRLSERQVNELKDLLGIPHP